MICFATARAQARFARIGEYKMSYVQDNLMPNEKVLFSARIHPAIFLPAVVSFIASAAVVIYAFSLTSQQNSRVSLIAETVFCMAGLLILYSIVLGLQALIIMFTTEFAVTNRRVIAKTGFIRRHTLEMLLTKIESVAVHQNILGRLLNFGSVTVTGTGGTKESFRAIVEPLDVRRKINQIIEHYTQTYAQQQGA
jgi:uncharacterized membrane protein YdbT with pleckstrin-like domain